MITYKFPKVSNVNVFYREAAKTIGKFTELICLKHFAIYIFDYSAPVGMYIAMWHPERIDAIIS